jgi:hypothetical protein
MEPTRARHRDSPKLIASRKGQPNTSAASGSKNAFRRFHEMRSYASMKYDLVSIFHLDRHHRRYSPEILFPQ